MPVGVVLVGMHGSARVALAGEKAVSTVHSTVQYQSERLWRLRIRRLLGRAGAARLRF